MFCHGLVLPGALLIFLFTHSLCSDIKFINKTFVATKEWQKVEEGQAIPQGLHVRINMHTGVKEAKLYEEMEEKNQGKAVMKMASKEEPEDLSPDKLKDILKNIKGDGVSSSRSNKFRSYEEIKKDFNTLNMQVKTDLEIVKGLVKNFHNLQLKTSTNDGGNIVEDEEILTTLVDLEYLVHQFDNAQEFAKLNGFTEVIHKSLNSSNAEVRSEALRLHGSATQANPKVQIAALESGSIQLLIKILSFDEDENVKARALYALSCLLRGFPAAQSKFLNDGGLTAFTNLINNKSQDFSKLKIKMVTLIHDLLFERKDVKLNLIIDTNNATASKIEDMKEQIKQYEEMNFEQKLVEQGWCTQISKWLLSYNLKDVATLNQHDAIAKIIDTIFAMSDICLKQFQNDVKLVLFLNRLKQTYVEMLEKDTESNNLYSSLSNILQMLTNKLTTDKFHTEL